MAEMPEIAADAGTMVVPRFAHSATLLADGRVLVAGGQERNFADPIPDCELYDPATNNWTTTGRMNTARYLFHSVRLHDGRVLATGRAITGETYDPATGLWTRTGTLSIPHSDADPVLLPNGQVLLAGGTNERGTASAVAELFDPATNTWSVTGSLNHARFQHRAVLLLNGQVLIVGGQALSYVAQSELYDSTTGQFIDSGVLNFPRVSFVGALLANGRCLIAGGFHLSQGTVRYFSSAEVYDPATGIWSLTGQMHDPRTNFSGSLLSDGRFLAVAGESFAHGHPIVLSTCDEYDSVAGHWDLIGSTLAHDRQAHTTTRLLDGSVLVAGGVSRSGNAVRDAELFIQPR